MADSRKGYEPKYMDARKEYKRLVKNAKAKITRIKNNLGVDVSKEINIPKFEDVNTSEKFYKFANEMTAFTDRYNLEHQYEKNSKGVYYSRAELIEGIQNTIRAQENAREFIDRFKDNPYYVEGNKAGYTVGDRMTLSEKENVAGISVPDDFDVDNFETRARLKGRLDLLEDKASGRFFNYSMENMKNNFMKALRGTYNSDGDTVINMLKQVPADDFFELYLMHSDFTFEDYASDGSIEANENQLHRLESFLGEYFAGNIDMDLKGF